MKQKKRTLTTYTDAVVARVHNRRISIIETDKNGECFIVFDRVLEKGEPKGKDSANCKVLRGKVRQTVIRLSEAAIHELYATIEAKLNRDSKSDTYTFSI